MTLNPNLDPKATERFPNLERPQHPQLQNNDFEAPSQKERLRPNQFTASEISTENLAQAMSVIDVCFKLQEVRDAALTTYTQWINGPRAYHSEFQGKGVELLGYYLYGSGDTPAGVAGIYRLEGEPDKVWMGWFGVKPEFRKSTLEKEGRSDEQPISKFIFDHVRGEALKHGASKLAVFTADNNNYVPAHKFYENHGFKLVDKWERAGYLERTYELPLAGGGV